MSKKQGLSLFFFAPGLFGPPSAFPLEVDCPETIFLLNQARSDFLATRSGMSASLFELFCPAPGSPLVSSDYPWAALTRHIDFPGRDNTGYWLRADPVYLGSDQPGLSLIDAKAIGLTPEDARRYADIVRPVFDEHAISLDLAGANRWYLRLPEKAAISDIITVPLDQVMGQDVHRYLPSGSSGALWRGILNDVQMSLHRANDMESLATPKTKRRLAINSLWFWGAGVLPAPPPESLFDVVFDDTLLGRSMAAWSGAKALSLPDDIAGILDQVSDGDQVLIVFEEGHRAICYQDIAAWQRWISRLDAEWFSPLQRYLKTGSVAEFSLFTGRSYHHGQFTGLARFANYMRGFRQRSFQWFRQQAGLNTNLIPN